MTRADVLCPRVDVDLLALAVDEVIRVLGLFPVEELVVNQLVVLTNDLASVLLLTLLLAWGVNIILRHRRRNGDLSVNKNHRWPSNLLIHGLIVVFRAFKVESALRCVVESFLFALLQSALSVVALACLPEDVSFLLVVLVGTFFLLLVRLGLKQHKLVVERGVRRDDGTRIVVKSMLRFDNVVVR